MQQGPTSCALLGQPAVARFAALLIGLTLASPAVAHPPPLVEATLKVDGDDRLELELRCDVVALAMQAPQGHLGQLLAEAWQAMSDGERLQRLADAKKSLEFYTQLQLDSQPARPLKEFGVQWNDNAVAALPVDPHADPADFRSLRLRVRLPVDAEQLRITFPEALGRVELIHTPPGNSEERQRLSAAMRSAPLPLTHEAVEMLRGNRARGVSAADIIPLALFALAVLLVLFGAQIKRKWRSAA
jgi:hypothetical protein